MMVEENEKTNIELWLKSGLCVGAISVGGYLLGFAYEKGYADYFAIPIQLIKLNLISIFVSILGLVAIILILLTSYLNLGFMILSKRRSVIFRDAIIRSAPSVLICAAIFYIYRNTPWFYWVVWIITWPVFVIFVEFCQPLISQRKKGTYCQKLEAEEEITKKMAQTRYWGLFTYYRRGMITWYLITVIFLLYIFANWVGTVEAQAQKSFWVIREPQPLVVLRIYGDRFICAPFDFKAGTVEKNLYIVDTPKQGGLWLEWQQIGPLKPIDQKVSDKDK